MLAKDVASGSNDAAATAGILATPRGAGRYCTICQRVDRDKIDEAILLGSTQRAVARAFDLKQPTLHRHAARCLRPRVAARVQAHEDAIGFSVDAILERLRARNEAAEELFKRFMESGAVPKDPAGLLREMRASEEFAAQLLGLSPKKHGGDVNVDARTQILALKDLTTEQLVALAGKLRGTGDEQ